MNFSKLIGLILFFGGWYSVKGQTIVIQGNVIDESTRKPIPNAQISIEKTEFKTTTSAEGTFSIQIKEPGFYVVGAEAEGYKEARSFEQLFTYDKQAPITIEMESLVDKIGEVNIKRSSLQKRNVESPLSAQELSIREIERNPGGNRDISKIIQSLPGVISVPSFRNDIVIRGGSPAENKFYLDGIEIPVINHFQTQGASGGPVGLLNVNFIKSVNFYTGAFPVNYSNGLSAVGDFQQIEGNKQKSKFRFTLGSSDLGFTADGPLGKKKKVTYIFSARQSYLQGLFTLLKLPFLPNFIDYQGKVSIDLKGKDNLTFITVGAFDFFKLNTKVNDGLTDSARLKNNRYILGNIPYFSQWNYTFGSIYTHYGRSTKTQVFLSRNMLYNESNKYKNNDESDPNNRILNYISTEEENKLRVEHTGKLDRWKWMLGAGSEFSQYGIDNEFKVVSPAGIRNVAFKNNLDLFKYNAFARISGNVFSNTALSASVRVDGNNYNNEMANPLNQPTFAVATSTQLSKRLFFNTNLGQYHQLPTYSILGYRESNILQNKERTSYIRNQMVSAGFQYNQGTETKITWEGFYKQYSRYPFTLNDSISLANLGADFAALGNEPINSIGKGRAYGTEFLVQRRSRNGLYGILSYTLSWSQFEDKNGEYVASSWDSRHNLSITAGKKLKKNWEIGAKWRFVTGRPFTPVDVDRSMNKAYWDIRGVALPNYNLLNTGRVGNFNQFDIRIDKVWYRPKWSLNLYVDIQNFFNAKYYGPETLIAAQNSNGSLVTDPNNSNKYLPDFLINEGGTVLPTIGIILDF